MSDRMRPAALAAGRFRRRFAVLAIGCLVASVAPARAFNPLSCGFDSLDEPIPAGVRSCEFRFTGTPLRIHAYATGGAAIAPEVRVWVSPGGNPEVALVECAASGRGSGATYVACDRDLSLLLTEAVLPDTPSSTHVTLTCHVDIVGTGGGYGCSSPEPA